MKPFRQINGSLTVVIVTHDANATFDLFSHMLETFAEMLTDAFVILSTFIILINLTRNLQEALLISWNEAMFRRLNLTHA